jgi:copper chaperone CopZ
MNSQEVASKVVDAVHLACEGYIGKVTADLEKQVFTAECDATKINQEKVLVAINETGYKAELVSSQQSP